VSRFTVIEAEQRSAEWFSARAGRLTGSRACDMLARIKTGEAAARRDYRMQLAIERITGKTLDSDGYVSKDMQRGIDLEPIALAAYEADTGNMVRKTGFLQMADFMAGCSLDGDIDNFRGILELKCPKSTTHVGYLKAREVPNDYLAQVTHNLWVTGAEWCDFCTFDDRLPEGLQFLRIRVERNESAIQAYEEQVVKFLAEVALEEASLLSLRSAA
jgi:predicted phage-related endonuclease